MGMPGGMMPGGMPGDMGIIMPGGGNAMVECQDQWIWVWEVCLEWMMPGGME